MTERDESLDGIVEVLKAPAPLSADLVQRVMAEVGQLPPHGPGGTRVHEAWWRRRWTIRVSPIGGLAAAAAVAALFLAGRITGRSEVAPVPAASVDPLARPTQFVLVAPEASSVVLVGDFNDWNLAATPLVRADGDGVWHVTVPLAPGRYRYTFVVDGEVWRNDPEAPAAEDEFGRPNSVVTVGGA